MNIVPQLNTYVQRVSRADPLYVLKRDGNVEPPSFVGSLSAPGFTSVSVYSGAGLPSKLSLRKYLAESFIRINAIDLALPSAPLPLTAEKTDNAVVAPDPTSVILRRLSLGPCSFVAIRTYLLSESPYAGVSFDATLHSLLLLLSSERISYSRNTFGDVLWSLSRSPMLSENDCVQLLSLLRVLENVALPPALQYRDKELPLPKPYVITTALVSKPWVDIGKYTSPDASLRHQALVVDGEYVHKFTYIVAPDLLPRPRCCYITLPVADPVRQQPLLQVAISEMISLCKPNIVDQRTKDALRLQNILPMDF